MSEDYHEIFKRYFKQFDERKGMGEDAKRIKVWFKRNAKIVSTYFKLRAKSKQEIMLRGFGGVLTVWTVAIFAGLVALATNQTPQWGLVWAAGLGATGQYLTQVYRVIFGKPKVADEEIDAT